MEGDWTIVMFLTHLRTKAPNDGDITPEFRMCVAFQIIVNLLLTCRDPDSWIQQKRNVGTFLRVAVVHCKLKRKQALRLISVVGNARKPQRKFAEENGA